MVLCLTFKKRPISVIEIAPGERASDPDVFQLADGRWGMLITWLEGTAFFVSDTCTESMFLLRNSDHHRTYRPFYGLGVSHYIPDEDVYWTYVNTPQDIPGTQEFMIQIERAIHADFDNTLTPSDFDVVLKEGDGSGLPSGYWAASPGFTFNQP